MGLRARQEQEKAAMRTLILEAAKTLILEEGYEKLSMRKIAAAIGYSPTTLYIYYKNKADIVQDLSLTLYENMMVSIQAYLKDHPQDSVKAQLKTMYKLFVQSMIQQQQTGDAIRSSSIDTMATLFLIQQKQGNGLELVADLLRQGEAEGLFTGITEHTPWMLQTSLIGFTSYCTSTHIYQEEGWDALLEQYVSMLIRGISLPSD